MAEREVRIRFTGDSAVLKGSAGDVRKIFQDLIDDENDARTTGEKLAAAMTRQADSMRADMAQTSAAADLLADALGPEMVAAIEASGRTVEDEVVKFQKLGLSLDDVRYDADALAAGMKQLDDAARQSTGSMGDGFRKVATETDNSRSVMANFTGNAISELPGVAGAFGPLNMALGQFTEYATEGNVKLKGLVGMGAGIAIMSAAMANVADNTERVAKARAFNDDQVKAYSDALANTDSRLDAIVEKLKETRDLEIQIGDQGDGFFASGFHGITTVINLTEAMANLGLTYGQIATIIDGGQEKVDEFTAALEAQGLASTDAAQVHEYLTGQLELLATAEKSHAAFAALSTEAVEEATAATRLWSDAANEARTATDNARIAQEQLKTVLEGLDDTDALLNLQQGFDDLKQMAIDNYIAVAEGSMTAEESTRNLTLATNDQKRAVAEYATEIAGVPAEKATQMVVNMDLSNLDALESRLNFLANNNFNVNVHASLIADSSLRNLLEGRDSVMQVRAGVRT